MSVMPLGISFSTVSQSILLQQADCNSAGKHSCSFVLYLNLFSFRGVLKCVCVMFLMQRSGMSDLCLPLIIQYEETSYAHEICWLISTGKKRKCG